MICDGGATCILRKSLEDCSLCKPKVEAIQTAHGSTSMNSTHLCYKTYYVCDSLGEVRPIIVKAYVVPGLKNELESVKVTSKSKFIIFGSTAREIYDEYYEKYFPDNKVFYLKHYSGYGDDRTWVEKVWERLNIDDKNFNEEKDKYKKHK